MQNFRHVTHVTTLDVPIATREAVINYVECKIGRPNPVTSVTLSFFSQLSRNFSQDLLMRNIAMIDSLVCRFSLANWEACCRFIQLANYPSISRMDTLEVFILW